MPRRVPKRCRYCYLPIRPSDTDSPRQQFHTRCIKKMEPDIVIRIGDYQFSGYSALLHNKKKLKRWWLDVYRKLEELYDYNHLRFDDKRLQELGGIHRHEDD